jgi:hypothetical protein
VVIMNATPRYLSHDGLASHRISICQPGSERVSEINVRLFSLFLVLTYVVLPPVSTTVFQVNG